MVSIISALLAVGKSSKVVTVTTWADSGIEPDFAPGRWVQIGKPNWFTFFLTGLPGGKFYFKSELPFIRYEKSKVPFENHKTKNLPASSLKFPTGFGVDGYIKGLLGQRKVGD